MVLVFLFLPAAYTYTRWQSVVSKNAAAVGGINVWGVLFRNNGIEPGNCTMVASTRAFVRLASRSELFGCSVVFSLLFLPVAGYRIGLSHDASQGRYWSSVTASNNGESMRALAAYFTKAQFNTGAIFPRHSLLAIRLASRSELFGCSVVFGLLFLPAAVGSFARYWSIRCVSEPRAFCVNVQNSYANFAEWMDRVRRHAIRLASRSGLFGCSVVGLLFLPAVRGGSNAFYWSSQAAGVSQGVSYAEELAFAGAWKSLEWDRPRQQGDAIRLASRSELFSCSFDGFGLLFLPAAAGEFGRYWSLQSATDTAEGIIRAYGTHWQPNGYLTLQVLHNRQGRLVVRLASRLGLSFVMSVVLSSVPARCEEWEECTILVQPEA